MGFVKSPGMKKIKITDVAGRKAGFFMAGKEVRK